MKEINFDKLKKVTFKLEKEALDPKELHCPKCHINMKLTEMEIPIDEHIYMRLQGFECPTCHKKSLGLEEAKKLDKALLFSRAMNKDYKIERNLSFDGDNYLFRIPKEFTQSVSKRKIEIVPLSAKEFCATVE
ncbi:MAG: hypothetical protein AABX70_04575 [Nanoarchaeota archaeon]